MAGNGDACLGRHGYRVWHETRAGQGPQDTPIPIIQRELDHDQSHSFT